MQEKVLLRISLAIGLLGVILLYFLSSGISLKNVKSLEGTEEGEEVQLQGKLSRVTEVNKTVFLEILNEKIERTTIILFKEEDISLKPGDYVEITGTIETYEGEKEVIGNKVVKK